MPPSPVPRGHCRGRHIDAIGFLQTLAPRPTALHCGPFPFPLLVNSLRREERPQTRSLPAAQRSFLSFFPSLPPPRLSVSALRSAVLLTQSSLVALAAVHLDSVPSCLFPFGPQIRPRLAHAHATILTNCRFLARLGSARLCPHVTARRSGGPPPATCHRTRAWHWSPSASSRASARSGFCRKAACNLAMRLCETLLDRHAK